MGYIRLHAVQVALLLLAGCNSGISDGISTKQTDAIRALGTFANVESDGEHAYGYSVQLWQRGESLIGLVDSHRGILGDPPMGIITDVKYDKSTGALSFKAKLTSGLHSCKEHTMVPSRDLLSFIGSLRDEQLQGRVIMENLNDSTPGLSDSRENFVMPIKSNYELENYENYDAWWRHWEPIYEVRGPKW